MTRSLSVFTLTRPADTRDTGTDDWRDQAVCASTGIPELWFDTEAEPAARDICHECPVQTECLTDALLEEGALGGPSRYGVRGGLNPEERAALSRQRRKKQARP